MYLPASQVHPSFNSALKLFLWDEKLTGWECGLRRETWVTPVYSFSSEEKKPQENWS